MVSIIVLERVDNCCTLTEVVGVVLARNLILDRDLGGADGLLQHSYSSIHLAESSSEEEPEPDESVDPLIEVNF